MAADRIHLVDIAPPHCSGCYQQKPEQKHVDFEAAYDGPVLPALDGAVGVVGHAIDDLILCEDCIRIAARLVGLDDVTELIKVRARLEETRDTLVEKVRALEEHNKQLTATLASGAQVERTMRPAPILPKPAGDTRPAATQHAASSPRNAPAKPRAKRTTKSKGGQRRQSAAAKAAAAQGGDS